MIYKKIKFIAIATILLTSLQYAKDYKGAELRTDDTFTYGRFEVSFIPAKREGVVSSFFTYHEISDLAQWNEIDFEFIGRYDNNIQMNVITSGQVSHHSSVPLNFNPYVDFHTYAFEWTPSYIAWFVDGVEIYRQTESHISTVNRDQKIMMNIWPPVAPNWVGEMDEATLPARAFYDWVSYSSYTPGQGTSGSNNDFTLQWKDDFDTYDSNRWSKGTHTWSGNYSDFVVENVQFQDGFMILCLTKAGETGFVDNQAPTVLWAKENSRNQVKVRFGEEVDKTSAETISNYIIPGATITSASLSDDLTEVTLNTDGYNQDTPYNIIIQNITDNESTPNKMSAAAKTIIQTGLLEYPIKINVGGEAFDDYLADQEWAPEFEYGYLDGDDAVYPPNHPISNTDNPQPYRSDRYNLVEYRVNVEPGIYRVTLQFAEKYFDNAGSRLFDITLEDQKIADDFDVLDHVGKNEAYELSSEVFVGDDRLDIYFTNEIDYGILSGIIIEQITTDVSEKEPLKHDFRIGQNYPNPFNPSTTIEYSIASKSFVSIKVFDLLGREVASLVNEVKDAGKHRISFDAAQLAAGIYFYRLNSSGINSETKKMIYLK